MLTALLTLTVCLIAAGSDRPNITGVVVDENNQPVAGARVDITTAAPLVGRGVFCPSCYADCVKFARTSDTGEFTIESLDPTLKFRLLASKPGKQAFQTSLINPRDGKLTITLQETPQDLPPERLVRGIVVTPEGKPIEGALVEPYGARTTSSRWWGEVKGVIPTITDAEGQFALLVPADFRALDVEVTADGHCGAIAELLAPGAKQHEIPVQRGAGVFGRLVREGKPLAGAQVAVVQTDRSVGNEEGIHSPFIKAVSATTDKAGRFEVHHLPPAEDYVLFSVVGSSPQEMVVTTKGFYAPASDNTRDLGDVEVQPALKISGRVSLPEGEKLPQDAKLTVGRDPAWDLISIPIAEDGRFEIAGLPPETYELNVAAKNWLLDSDQVKYQMLSDTSFGLRLKQSLTDLEIPLAKGGDKKANVARQPGAEAKLVPNPGGWISGRILADGKPRAGISVDVSLVIGPDDPKPRENASAQVVTDKDGRFRVGGFETGDRYMVEVDIPEGFSQQPWNYGLPYVHTVEDANQEIQLPDLRIISGSQSLAGKVVDLEGKPLAGITVSVQTLEGRSLPFERDRATFGDTDQEGRFTFSGLPHGKLQLFAYRHFREHRMIRYPVTVRPAEGQQDIRIVLDPTLLFSMERFPD